MPRPTVFPTGWFQVAWSADLGVSDVLPLHYFGTDLVAYRGMDGVVNVLDAHCQHLGANLSLGGCVVEDGIQCPFHGWVWNGRGKNVRIPYEAKPNRARRIRSWAVTEINESIYIWHDSAGGEPTHTIPDVTSSLGQHIDERTFRPVSKPARSLTKNIRVHPQTVAENAVDPEHFHYVHGTSMSPVVLTEETDGPTWLAKVGFGRRWQDKQDREGDFLNTLIIRWTGLGVSYNGEKLKGGVRITGTCPTPVDDIHSDIFNTYWIDETFEDFEGMCQQATDALLSDCKIWDNQIYMDPPGLSPSEIAGFRKLRNWAANFYPDGADLRAPQTVVAG